MDEKLWKVELIAVKNEESCEYCFTFKATEKWADDFLDALVLGFELKDFEVGGGIRQVISE